MSNRQARPPGMMRTISGSFADLMSRKWDVPAERQQAFREQASICFEQAIVQALGADSWTVAGRRVRGWVMPPSEREARRKRIFAALLAGDSIKAISQREGVGLTLVKKLRRQQSMAEVEALSAP